MRAAAQFRREAVVIQWLPDPEGFNALGQCHSLAMKLHASTAR